MISKEVAALMSKEASKAMFDALPNECVSDETRVLLLCRMMLAFVDEKSHDEVESKSTDDFLYRLFKSIIAPCLESSHVLQEKYWTPESQGSAMDQLLDLLWDRLCTLLARLLRNAFQKELSTEVFNDLIVTVDSISMHPNDRYSSTLCGVLASTAMNCLDLELPSSGDKSGDDYSDESLKLFGSCFGGICKLNPKERSLPVIAKQVLLAAGEELSNNDGEDKNDLTASQSQEHRSRKIESCIVLCRSMQETLGMELVVTSVFSLLCDMVDAPHDRLRGSVAAVLSKVNIGKVLEEIKGQHEAAEKRALKAEERERMLSKQMEELRKENEALQRQLAFIS